MRFFMVTSNSDEAASKCNVRLMPMIPEVADVTMCARTCADNAQIAQTAQTARIILDTSSEVIILLIRPSGVQN